MKKSTKWSISAILCLIIVVAALFFVDSFNEAETTLESNSFIN